MYFVLQIFNLNFVLGFISETLLESSTILLPLFLVTFGYGKLYTSILYLSDKKSYKKCVNPLIQNVVNKNIL